MKSQPNKNSGGATFYVACGALVSMAMVQVGIALWGMQVRTAGRDPTLKARLPVIQQAPSPPVAPSPPPVAVVTEAGKIQETSVGVAQSPDQINALPREPEQERSPAVATKNTPITDEKILDHLEAGLLASQKGDMLSALQAFRSAFQIDPQHPRLIYQMAKAYDLLGQDTKAQPLWNSLIKMGEAAGDYYRLAEIHVNGKDVVTAGPAESEQREGRLKFGQRKVETIPLVQGGGQKKLLSFTINKTQDEPIKSEDVALVIHFFDLKNKSVIDRTTAAPPQPVVVSTVEDWEQRGVQRLEVLYHQAAMSPAELIKKNIGHRTYGGYVLELYLRDSVKGVDRLQDLVADPPSLIEFSREIPMPADTETVPSEPSLFPN